MKELSIIGYGSFGKFMAKHLSKYFTVNVYDKNSSLKSTSKNIVFKPLKDCLKTNIIILAVPMEAFEEVVKSISSSVSRNSLVLDVCSLKEFSEDIMKKYFNKNVQIIGTHPLFGPQSAKNNIKGMRICLVKTRCDDLVFEKVKKFLKKIGLEVIITTSKEHDKQMAASQALTHFIGRSISNLRLDDVSLKTKTYEDLMNITKIISEDSEELFLNIQNKNKYAKKAREDFIKKIVELNKKLK